LAGWTFAGLVGLTGFAGACLAADLAGLGLAATDFAGADFFATALVDFEFTLAMMSSLSACGWRIDIPYHPGGQ
jgi:hypothetical protein